MKFLPAIGKSVSSILLAIAAVAVISGVLIALRGFLSISVIALLYLLVVVLCTTLRGYVAGVTSSVLAFLTFNYFFLPPFYSFTIAHTEDLIALLVFLTVAVVISNLMGRAQTRLEQIQAREREASHLYELSSTFTAIRDEKQIAEVLAQHLLEIFQGQKVEVLIQPDLSSVESPSEPGIRVVIPEDPTLEAAFEQSQALSTSRGQLGTIRLWTRRPTLSPSENQLLQTIASQAALAVERTLLSKAENRTRVLEESDRLKTAILSSVSHDLRTPLASIQAAASSLYDSSVSLEPEAKVELQSLLLEETEHLNQLVGNLLNMSRIEAGALKLQKQWNSMADIIDTVVGRIQFKKFSQRFQVDVSEDLPLVQLDAVLIEQVFINLISNSLKYTPSDSQITIRAFVADPAWMQITLLNQGPPIPKEHLEHIFEKFYTYPGMRQVSSTGLGLSICKGIVEAHGGRIWAANLSDGLSISFTLPLSKPDALIPPPDEGMPTE
jgi:two-component system sensor histidine kinase KdpD